LSAYLHPMTPAGFERRDLVCDWSGGGIDYADLTVAFAVQVSAAGFAAARDDEIHAIGESRSE